MLLLELDNWMELDNWTWANSLELHIIVGLLIMSRLKSILERASEADISRLPKYKVENMEQPGVREFSMISMGTNGQDYFTELVLTKYAGCSICLCHYEDGEQLHLLLCCHHFHSTCIVKWLRLKATCPVCKSLVVSRPEESIKLAWV
ncbi:putative transcription factor C2H2 family [Helianthus anomalus]